MLTNDLPGSIHWPSSRGSATDVEAHAVLFPGQIGLRKRISFKSSLQNYITLNETFFWYFITWSDRVGNDPWPPDYWHPMTVIYCMFKLSCPNLIFSLDFPCSYVLSIVDICICQAASLSIVARNLTQGLAGIGVQSWGRWGYHSIFISSKCLSPPD